MDLLPGATAADEARRDARVAVLPVGSFEQHGEHLPLVTDTVIACVLAARIAETHDLLLLPPITFSCSHEHEGLPGLPGTVSISAGTLINVIDDIRASLARSGVTELVLVNGHGGNYVLANIAQQANVEGPDVKGCGVLLFPGREDWATARAHAGAVTTGHDDMHGGEMETSILLHAHPELVGGTYPEADHEAGHRPHLLVTGMRGYTSNGIIGRPSRATPAKGRAALDSLTASFADHLEALHGPTGTARRGTSGNAAITETIARAVIRRAGRLLVARERGRSWSFLPGGHVESGERVEAALVRELSEELGTHAEIAGFLGVVEHGYTEGGTARHEINLVFEVTIADTEPVSQEEHLEFHWLPLDQLAEADLRPGALRTALATAGEGRTPFWHGWNG